MVTPSLAIKRSLCLLSFLALLAIHCFAVIANAGQPLVGTETKPNVLLIVVDDLGATDLGCYGSDFYETPQIDRLAGAAVRFRQFYSAHPVCSPTRAALMTGKTPQRLGITNWIPQPSSIHLPHSERTLAERLKSAGYDTGFIGKWHLGEKDDQLPTSHGFDWQRCVNRGGQPGSYFSPFQSRRRQGLDSSEASYWDVPDLAQKKTEYLTDGLTDYAIEFLKQKRESPFFLNLCYYSVHTPIQAPKNLVQKFRDKRERLFQSESPFHPEVFQSQTRSRQDNPTYAAMVHRLDENVGRILATLRELELENSTLVIFTSDNGGLSTLRRRPGPTSTLPFRAGKGWTYEGGIRIPTLISWEGRLKSRDVETPAISMDLYPTVLQFCGLELEPQQHLDGQSLVGLALGKSEPSFSSRLLGWFFPHPHGSGHRPSAAIRVGDLKLIQRLESNMFELYNLAKDPGEKVDISKSNAEAMVRMRNRLKNWIADTNLNGSDE